MAIKKVSVEYELKYKEAAQAATELGKIVNAQDKKIRGLQDSLDETKKSADKTSKGIKGFGTSIKNIGKTTGIVYLIVKAFDILKETFGQNQQVLDIFNTAMESLSLAFNDLFSYLSNNVGTVIQYFKNIFDNPVQSIKNLSNALYEGIVNRFNQALEALGLFGKAALKFFSGDFSGAMVTAKEASKELFDVVTGEDGGYEKIKESVKETVQGITEYAKSTVKAAQETVKLNKAAEIGIAQNRIILEQKDREAEKLRQIRDDESKTIAERIAANNKLAEVLDEQERLMLANADAVIASAQAQYDKNQNDENYIALLDARAEKEGILAQIEGFRSEQLTNINSLERERMDLQKEADEKEIERKQALADVELGIIERVQAAKQAALDQTIAIFGAESAVGKAALVAKQILAAQELILEAKKTITFSSQAAARSAVSVAEGTAQTAKIGFPQNIPMLIAYALQAVGIISSIKSAVGAAKTSAGGAGGSVQTPSAPSAPSFNIVGAAPENQLAQTIGQQEDKPVKAFVVSQEVSSQQALDRNIESSASLG